ncbi:MAG: DUF1385 domain-containing protein [Fimbriimonadales bacterium]
MDQLSQPIGLLMRPTYTVDLQDSLELAARKLRENGSGVLPVTENGTFAGVVTEGALAGALASGLEMTDPVAGISHGSLTAKPNITGAEALRLFDGQSSSALIVIDDAGRVLGIVTPSDLYPKRISPPRPPVVGGMATPFGVYLTTGSIRAGAGHWALLTTGMILFGLLTLGNIVTGLLTDQFPQIGISAGVASFVQTTLPFVLFLAGMRIIPLSGIHAAEHKVVHAIERGEELVPSTVRRMPRVHPRCGTNLVVGATLFILIASVIPIPWLRSYSEPRLILAAIVTLVFWRPLGSATQYYVTTKRPTDKQLMMGIRSGKELLHKYATTPGGQGGIGQRILNSGMLHVIAGSCIALGILLLIVWVFHLPIDVVG